MISNTLLSKSRNRSATLSKLQQAIATLSKSNKKLTITAVAKAAGVTPGLIHNSYPEIASQINEITGKSIASKAEKNLGEIKRLQTLNRELTRQLRVLKSEFDELASVNMTLFNELRLCKSIATSNGKIRPIK
jgi:DNA topoisomerase IB